MKQGWKIKKLESVCNVNYGTRVVQKKDGGTLYPVYGGGGATFRIDRFNRKDCLIVSRFAMSSQCVRYVAGKFFLNDSGLTVESSTDEICQDFLDKHIIALNDKIYSLGKGAAQRNLDITALKNLDIHFPTPIAEQEKIVAELDCLSGVIEKKKQQLKELDALAQSIFYEMFGDPIENDKGWDVRKLKSVTSKIGSGATPKGGNQAYKDEGVSLIRSLNVHNNHFVYKDLAHIDDLQAASLNNVVVQEKDVLLNITGASVARCCVVPNDVLPARVNQHVAIIRPDKNLDNMFLCFQFTTSSYQQELLSIGKSNGATREALTKAQLESLSIILPSLSLQQEFASKIEAIEKQKELIKQSIQETETLFNSRMDYYFN